MVLKWWSPLPYPQNICQCLEKCLAFTVVCVWGGSIGIKQIEARTLLNTLERTALTTNTYAAWVPIVPLRNPDLTLVCVWDKGYFVQLIRLPSMNGHGFKKKKSKEVKNKLSEGKYFQIFNCKRIKPCSPSGESSIRWTALGWGQEWFVTLVSDLLLLLFCKTHVGQLSPCVFMY